MRSRPLVERLMILLGTDLSNVVSKAANRHARIFKKKNKTDMLVYEELEPQYCVTLLLANIENRGNRVLKAVTPNELDKTAFHRPRLAVKNKAIRNQLSLNSISPDKQSKPASTLAPLILATAILCDDEGLL